MARRGFHRELVGALCAIAGGALGTRFLILGLGGPALTVIATVLGAALGAWFAVRGFPRLRAGDAALAAAVGVLVLEAGYRVRTSGALDLHIVASSAGSALAAAAIARRLRRDPPAGVVARGALAGLVVTSVAGFVHAGSYAIWGGESGIFLGAIAGGAAASALVLELTVMQVVLGFAAVFTATFGIGLALLLDRPGEPMLVAIALVGLLGGSVLVGLGAGLGMLLRPRAVIAPDPLPVARLQD